VEGSLGVIQPYGTWVFKESLPRNGGGTTGILQQHLQGEDISIPSPKTAQHGMSHCNGAHTHVAVRELRPPNPHVEKKVPPELAQNHGPGKEPPSF
jgi:hypothetical protein